MRIESIIILWGLCFSNYHLCIRIESWINECFIKEAIHNSPDLSVRLYFYKKGIDWAIYFVIWFTVGSVGYTTRKYENRRRTRCTSVLWLRRGGEDFWFLYVSCKSFSLPNIAEGGGYGKWERFIFIPSSPITLHFFVRVLCNYLTFCNVPFFPPVSFLYLGLWWTRGMVF